MPFLALTYRGIALARAAIWYVSDLIPEEEHADLIARGVDLTRLSYSPQDADLNLLKRAVDSMAEHHSDEPVWIEAVAVDSFETQE